MSAALAPPNPSACTLILIGRNSKALLLSAAFTMPTGGRQSKATASLVTAVKLTSAVGEDESIKLSMLRPRLMDMSQSIRKIVRQSLS
jgi:hypothetical protein